MTDPRQKLLTGHFFVFLLSALLLVFANQYLNELTPRPVHDSVRYIRYALNLLDHGVFGLTKNSSGEVEAGNENTPLYPLLIAAAAGMDKELKQTLSCLAQDEQHASCELHLRSFAYLQSMLIVVTLASIWLLASLLSGSLPLAWLSALLAFACGELQEYANLLLTEILIITLFSLSTLTLALALATAKRRWYALFALLLGLLTLTRPEYHYLFIAFVLLLSVVCLRQRKRQCWQCLMLVFVAYYLSVGSWQLRNYQHFGDAALTGEYGSIILAHRVAYNRMTAAEWGIAFIYWFPDVGDSIVRRLFSEQAFSKLSFDAGSYYQQGSQEIMAAVSAHTDSADAALAYLLKEEIIGNLSKHTLVTFPLFWRGLFIAKYWGVLGLLCCLALARRWREPAVRHLFYLSLPAWFLVALHAFISINIPRYNLFLLPFYAIAIAMLLLPCIRRLRERGWRGRQAEQS